MFGRIVRVVCAVGLVYSLALLPVIAADGKDSPSTKPPDWSHYKQVGNLFGEIVKADDKKITLRVSWLQQSGSYRRPGSRGRGSAPRAKQQHHDYEIPFVPESLVRSKKLPPKLGDNGKRVDYTQKELDNLRLPNGVTGYAASPADLEPGTLVEVILVRDRSISAAKATEDDVRVKYAIILGKDTTPPKGADKDDKKGKKKN
jgi:hypothetical protein